MLTKKQTGKENVRTLMVQIFVSVRSNVVEVQYHQVRVAPSHIISVFIAGTSLSF